MIAAFLYLGGVLVFEGIGGWYLEGFEEHPDLTYNLIATVEEMLEMAGLIVLIYTLMQYIRRHGRDLVLCFDDNGKIDSSNRRAIEVNAELPLIEELQEVP